RPVPLLQTFLTPNRELDIAKLLIVHQSVHTISRAKSWNRVGAMFIDAADEIICNPDVKRAANVTGKDVNPIAAVDAHSAKPVVRVRPETSESHRCHAPRKRGIQ